MLQTLIADRRFAAVGLLLVLVCGAVALWEPALGFWCVAAALLPVLALVFLGKAPAARSGYELLLGGFLLTCIVAWLVAYDPAAAREKMIALFLAVLLFHAVAAQPEENLAWVTVTFAGLGLLVAAYFFLTHDFVEATKNFPVLRQAGGWLMRVRPTVDWAPIPSGQVAGLVALGVLGLVGAWSGWRSRWQQALALIALGMAAVTVVLTTSASVWVALAGAAGACLAALVLDRFFTKARALLPVLLVLYLLVVSVALYIEAPAASANPNSFGQNNRVEVFVRSLDFLREYPFTGGGLASFAGQYSRYILNIPYFYFSTSYNLFLDVAIEQGLLAGLIVLAVYLSALWRVARVPLVGWGSYGALFVLVFVLIHSLMQDYLYTGPGAMALFFPVGLAWLLARPAALPRPALWQAGTLFVLTLGVLGLISVQGGLRSAWYSNMGAVQLARVELDGFPNTGWPGLAIVPKLRSATSSLQTSLELNADNLTANYRLGLIHILSRDFPAAETALSHAYNLAPHHRGVIKSYGYALLWQGKLDEAYRLLGPLPEIPNELDAYYSWWQEQGRPELADLAYALRQKLDEAPAQP